MLYFFSSFLKMHRRYLVSELVVGTSIISDSHSCFLFWIINYEKWLCFPNFFLTLLVYVARTFIHFSLLAIYQLKLVTSHRKRGSVRQTAYLYTVLRTRSLVPSIGEMTITEILPWSWGLGRWGTLLSIDPRVLYTRHTKSPARLATT